MSERARRCRVMASEAQRMSKDAEGEMKNVYFALSVHWMALANEIEKSRLQPRAWQSKRLKFLTIFRSLIYVLFLFYLF